MSWSFDALSAPLSSPTPTTQVRYNASEFNINGQQAQVRINGTGFTYDGTTGLLNGGSITSLELWDVNGAGTKLQTVTLGTPITGAAFFSYFSAAKTLQTTIGGWNLQFGNDDSGPGVFTDTLIEFSLADNTKIRIVGTGFGTNSDLGASQGTVTSVQHVNASNVQVGNHIINNINQPTSLVSMAFGNGEESYHFFTAGSNTVTQNNQNITFSLDGGLGNDTIDGGTNPFSAFVDYNQSIGAVTVVLTANGGTATGGAGNDTLINITGVSGSDFNDTLTGNDNNNQLSGDQGADVLTGNGGNDYLRGEDGADTLDGGAGNDSLEGGAGNDRFDAGGGTNQINTNGGSDTIVFSRLAGSTFVNDFGARVFVANLNGGNQVPPVTTDAQGFAQLQLVKDLSRAFFFSNINGIDYSGGQTPGNTADNMNGLHVHNGAAGVNGAVVWDIAADGQTTYNGAPNFPSFQAQSYWSNTEGLTGQLASLYAGNLYVNVHTTANGGGEIRGQLIEEAGGFADRIDVSALGISNMGDLSFILKTNGPNAMLESTWNGQVAQMTLHDVSIGSLTAADFIFGGSTDEVRAGTENDDDLFGGDGGDFLYGFAGNDRLIGGAGIDFLSGGAGNDKYVVDTFADAIEELADAGIDDVLSFDSYIFHANVENAQLAGSGNFGAIGNGLANSILGNSGNNGIDGGGGNDNISGGAGSDTILGGTGNDTMNGDAGVDVYFVDSSLDVVNEIVENGVYDTIWTTASIAALPQNVEIVILDGGNLDISANGNDDLTLMLGNNGNNALSGMGGSDVILGLAGNDTIYGGSGAFDLISGGDGADVLTGNAGHDYFSYENISQAGDTIFDFTTVAGDDLDILDLRPLWATFTNTAGITTSAQAVASGHLTYTQAGDSTLVFVDANGGGNNNVQLVELYVTNAALAQTLTLI